MLSRFASNVKSFAFLLSYILLSQSVNAQMMPDVGWETTLAGVNGGATSHNVGGTVSIVDSNTIRVEDFTFDGGGISVYFYLGTSESTFGSGLEIGPQLLGTVYDGTQPDLMIDLPSGSTVDGYNAVSVWCVAANASFGQGSFAAVPEPASVGLIGIAFAALIGIGCKRRKRDGVCRE